MAKIFKEDVLAKLLEAIEAMAKSSANYEHEKRYSNVNEMIRIKEQEIEPAKEKARDALKVLLDYF